MVEYQDPFYGSAVAETRTVGSQIASDRDRQPSTVRHLLSSLIERTDKLAGVAVEVANSIGGPENEKSTIGGDAAMQVFCDDLRGMISQLRTNIDRAEQAVLRAHGQI